MVAKYLSATFYRKQYPQYNTPRLSLRLCSPYDLKNEGEAWVDWTMKLDAVWHPLRKKFDIVRCMRLPCGQGCLSCTVVLRLRQSGLPSTLDVARSVLWDKDTVVMKLLKGLLPGIWDHVWSLLLEEDNYDFAIRNHRAPTHLHGPFYLYEFSINIAENAL